MHHRQYPPPPPPNSADLQICKLTRQLYRHPKTKYFDYLNFNKSDTSNHSRRQHTQSKEQAEHKIQYISIQQQEGIYYQMQNGPEVQRKPALLQALLGTS